MVVRGGVEPPSFRFQRKDVRSDCLIGPRGRFRVWPGVGGPPPGACTVSNFDGITNTFKRGAHLQVRRKLGYNHHGI